VQRRSMWQFPCDHDEQPVRCFSTFTCDLNALAEWLQRMRHPNGRDAIYRRIFCAEQRIDREG
jgi:hypothetical protein